MTPDKDNLEEMLRRELWRKTDEAALLRELLEEATGLTATGVVALVALHRRARGVQSTEFEPQDVLDALGSRWWPTGVIARALLLNGGRGMSARQRSDHHHRVSQMLHDLEREDQVESRRVDENGRSTALSAKQQRGRMEWRRVPA